MSTLGTKYASAHRNNPGSPQVEIVATALDTIETNVTTLQTDTAAAAGTATKYMFVSPAAFQIDTTAVVTRSVTSNIDEIALDQGDETAYFWCSLSPLLDAAATSGLKLTRIDIYYLVATANLDGITPALNVVTLPADGTAMTGTAIATTDVVPLTQDDHTGTMTVDTPLYLDGATYAYTLGILFDKAATTDLTFRGVRLVFTKS